MRCVYASENATYLLFSLPSPCIDKAAYVIKAGADGIRNIINPEYLDEANAAENGFTSKDGSTAIRIKGSEIEVTNERYSCP